MTPTVYCPTYQGLVMCQQFDHDEKKELADRRGGRPTKSEQARISWLRGRMGRRALKIERATALLLAINASTENDLLDAMIEDRSLRDIPF